MLQAVIHARIDPWHSLVNISLDDTWDFGFEPCSELLCDGRWSRNIWVSRKYKNVNKSTKDIFTNLLSVSKCKEGKDLLSKFYFMAIILMIVTRKLKNDTFMGEKHFGFSIDNVCRMAITSLIYNILVCLIQTILPWLFPKLMITYNWHKRTKNIY